MPTAQRIMFASLLLIALGSPVLTFNMALNTNLAVYWGQDSYGANNPSDLANWQQDISYYCADDSIDTLPIAFLNVFYYTGGVPSINLANSCNTVNQSVFPGTALLDCSSLAAGIQACQSKGKIVTISLGGSSGSIGFSDDTQAKAFAQTIWDLFLGGSSNTRPFGSAVLDGIDLDIEGGSQTGYTAFVSTLRGLMAGGSKQYYITAAPQCPFPDSYLGPTLNQVQFDAVYVQFYNNWCGLNNYNNKNAWNFGTWDNWAKTVSPNSNVKIYIGAPASPTAAGSGYVDPSTFSNIIQQVQSQYTSFGGVMLWDASQAYANGRYDLAVKAALTGGGGTGASSPPNTTNGGASTTPTASPTPSSGSSSCGGVAAWQASQTYVGGDQVSYNGHLWTAQWWTYGDVPGGPAGVWIDKGSCST